VFENRVLRGISGRRRKGVREAGKVCIMRSFMTYTHYQILLG